MQLSLDQCQAKRGSVSLQGVTFKSDESEMLKCVNKSLEVL